MTSSQPWQKFDSTTDIDDLEAPAPGAMPTLAPEDRELLVLKHLEGLTYEELAQRLGVPAGTVMSRLYHARRRFREKFTARQDGHLAGTDE